LNDLFNEAVPLLTRRTLANPFCRFVSAVGTKERRFDFTHLVKVTATMNLTVMKKWKEERKKQDEAVKKQFFFKRKKGQLSLTLDTY
jgi:hypothetical protein